ncbi:MAG: SDR family NAD(P)-dependent oxidoreductase [Chloroflexota bacterium]|nr:SDR family NAD(P)-dependent oxidoreductase [Chloroflexota bacterium]MDE2884318.1 SDR family NAD(P)-dependent oxidoreductase [Chloroflexota bacterium]
MTTPDLTGQIALVTGGSRGIGRQLALTMARHGATVVITARNLDASPGSHTLRGTVGEIEAAGGTAHAIPATITDSADAKRLLNETVERAGRLDVLVNNAGVFPYALIAEMSDEDWHDNMNVNLNAVFFVTRAALPVMARQGGGRIYNVSSDLAIRFAVGRVAYSAAKGALDVFSQALAREVREQNVEVVSWTPGFVRTDMTGPRARDGVESVEPSFLWMLAQPPMALTGLVLRKDEFGKTWGAGV